MFEFDDIIEEAVADVIEQAQNETKVEQMPFDPNSTDDYQYMLMLMENVNSSVRIYNKKEEFSFFRMLMNIMQTVSCECIGDIIFYNTTKKQYNSEITGRLYEHMPKNETIERYFSYQSWVALVVKFSFRDDLSINARLSKLLRMFTGIQSFKSHVSYNPYRDEDFNPYSCYMFKNDNDKWTPMQKDKINLKDIYKNFSNASNYNKAFNDKIVWYYKDFFMNSDVSNELLNPIIEELKYLMSLRWAIKVDANYLRQFGHYSRNMLSENILHYRRNQNNVCSV